eukprot:7184685-Pyramimonas_sp.AAC.1
MGANDAGCPAGTGICCAWVRHGSFAYSLSLGAVPLNVIQDRSALWAWIHEPSEPPAGAPAWHAGCILKKDACSTSCVGVDAGALRL